MNKQKLCVLSSTFILATMVFSCGGKPVAPTITGLEISQKETGKQFYFGDKINKSDFAVNLKYSDNTTKALSDNEFKVTKYISPLKPMEEVVFPYGLSYSSYSSSESFTFSTIDNSHAKTFKLNIAKKYNFEYGNASGAATFPLYYDNKNDVNFANVLKENGKDVENVYYSSSREGQIQVDSNNGKIRAIPDFSSFTGSAIFASINGIRVDQYFISCFNFSVENMSIDSTGIFTTCNQEARKTYNPNGAGKLYIPSIIKNDFATSIKEDGFSGCEAITYLEIPDSIKTIGKNAFSGCIGLTEKSIVIPESVELIYPRAFADVTAPFIFEETEGWNWYDETTKESGAIDSKYMADKETAKEILTNPFYCLDCILYRK